MNNYKDPYEQCIQYTSIEDGIKAHAETYSFNIESKLFNQLTKKQQILWRKEIEQACISGGEAGVELARDTRYQENIEVKDVDLEKEYKDFVEEDPVYNKLVNNIVGKSIAKHFFKLGLASQLSWKDIELIAKIGVDFMNSEDSDNLTDEEYYTEILNRLKAQKGG